MILMRLLNIGMHGAILLLKLVLLFSLVALYAPGRARNVNVCLPDGQPHHCRARLLVARCLPPPLQFSLDFWA